MPQTKKTPGQKMKDMAGKRYKMGPSAKNKKTVLKNPNTPGEGKRGFEGMVNRMVSMSESQFNKMIKNIRAKRR